MPISSKSKNALFPTFKHLNSTLVFCYVHTVSWRLPNTI